VMFAQSKFWQYNFWCEANRPLGVCHTAVQ
jgi:hypothetical protein